MKYFQFKAKIESFTQKNNGNISIVFKKDEYTMKYALEVDCIDGRNVDGGQYKKIPDSFDVSNDIIIEFLKNNLSSTFLVEFDEDNQIQKVTII